MDGCMQVRLTDENEMFLRNKGMKYNKSIAWLANKIIDMVREKGDIMVVEVVEVPDEKV
jgi:hypothetical protein